MFKCLSLISGCLLVLCTTQAIAQEHPYKPSEPLDEEYISDYKNNLIVRLYGSHKFTRLSYGEYGLKDKVLYKPNSNYNVGFGFNYKWLGLNIGFRAPFVNNDNDRLGRTKYLDLQAYVYVRKFVFDLYAQSYEGYYLANENVLDASLPKTLVRSDIQTRNLGGTFEYIFNHKRFSYRAVYLQNEYQRKSAGSFLAGGGFHYLNVRADSAILPQGIRYASFLDNDRFNTTSTGVIGINGGYAHTFVINSHFFIMGSLLMGVGVNSMTLKDDKVNTSQSQFSASYNGVVRAGLGYNSENNFAGIYFVTNIRHDAMPVSGSWQQYETGLLRIAVAHRFATQNKAGRLLQKTGLF